MQNVLEQLSIFCPLSNGKVRCSRYNHKTSNSRPWRSFCPRALVPAFQKDSPHNPYLLKSKTASSLAHFLHECYYALLFVRERLAILSTKANCRSSRVLAVVEGKRQRPTIGCVNLHLYGMEVESAHAAVSVLRWAIVVIDSPLSSRMPRRATVVLP